MFRVILTTCFSVTPYTIIETTHKGPFTTTNTFNGPLSGTTRVSQYQKGKTNLDITEARDNEWPWHQLGHVQVCMLLQADQHPTTRFFKTRCPSYRPTNSVNALKAFTYYIMQKSFLHCWIVSALLTDLVKHWRKTQLLLWYKLTFRQWFHKQQVSSISSEH